MAQALAKFEKSLAARGSSDVAQRGRLLRLCVTRLRAKEGGAAKCRAVAYRYLATISKQTAKALSAGEKKLLIFGFALCLRRGGGAEASSSTADAAALRPVLWDCAPYTVASEVVRKLVADRDSGSVVLALALLARIAKTGEKESAAIARKLFRDHARLSAAIVEPAFAILARSGGALTAALCCVIVGAAVKHALPAGSPKIIVAHLLAVEPPTAASISAIEALCAADARCDSTAIARFLVRTLRSPSSTKALRSRALKAVAIVLADVPTPLDADSDLARELRGAAHYLLDGSGGGGFDASSVLVAGKTTALVTVMRTPGVVVSLELLRRLPSTLELGSRNVPLSVGRLARDTLWHCLSRPTKESEKSAASSSSALPPVFAETVVARLVTLLRSVDDDDTNDYDVPRALTVTVLPSTLDGSVSSNLTPLRAAKLLFADNAFAASSISAASMVRELIKIAEVTLDHATFALLTTVLPFAPALQHSVALRTWLSRRCEAVLQESNANPAGLRTLERLLTLATAATVDCRSDTCCPFAQWLERRALGLLLHPQLDDDAAAALCCILVEGHAAHPRQLFGALATLSSDTANATKVLRLMQLLGHVAAASRNFIVSDEAKRTSRDPSTASSSSSTSSAVAVVANEVTDEYQTHDTQRDLLHRRSSHRLARCVRTSFISPYMPLVERLALGTDGDVVPVAVRCAALHTLGALMLMDSALVERGVTRVVELTTVPSSVAVAAVFLTGTILRADADRSSQRAAVDALTARLGDGSDAVRRAALAVLGDLLVSKQVQQSAVLPRIAIATRHASIGALATNVVRQMLLREGKVAYRLLFDIFCGLTGEEDAGSSSSSSNINPAATAVMRHIITVSKEVGVPTAQLALPLLHVIVDESSVTSSSRAREGRQRGRVLCASSLARSAAATLRLVAPSRDAATWKAIDALKKTWQTCTGGLQGLDVAIARSVAHDVIAYCKTASGRGVAAEKRDAALSAFASLPLG